MHAVRIPREICPLNYLSHLRAAKSPLNYLAEAFPFRFSSKKEWCAPAGLTLVAGQHPVDYQCTGRQGEGDLIP